MLHFVLVTELLKLAPSPEQDVLLRETLRVCNAAANHAAEVAHAAGTANKIEVQKLCYHELRERFGLSAQQSVRAIAKACGALKRDKSILPVFRDLGAIEYDQRILTWKSREAVSLLTMQGRTIIPVVYQGRWLAKFPGRIRGNADLVLRNNMWFLAAVIDVPEPPHGTEPTGWLGVDLGIVNVATTSTGGAYTGKGVRNVRRRNRELRTRLQQKNTRSAKRLLKKRNRKESRFARDLNHVISKAIVGEAKRTGAGIKLERLTGIRSRIRATKAQRADLGNWSFYQLGQFVAYKAAIGGVWVGEVDPRNTSRECSRCGHVDKRNRPDQASFRCLRCGHADHADHNAAVNISRRDVIGWAVSHAADDAA